jgi:hypothetical protein
MCFKIQVDIKFIQISLCIAKLNEIQLNFKLDLNLFAVNGAARAASFIVVPCILGLCPPVLHWLDGAGHGASFFLGFNHLHVRQYRWYGRSIPALLRLVVLGQPFGLPSGRLSELLGIELDDPLSLDGYEETSRSLKRPLVGDVHDTVLQGPCQHPRWLS